MKSYHLKTALLHCLNTYSKENLQCIAHNDVKPFRREFYVNLRSFIDTRNVPQFFYPDINLFSDIDFNSENVIKFCDLIRNEETLTQPIFHYGAIVDDHNLILSCH